MSFELKQLYEEWQADPANSGKKLGRKDTLALRPPKDYGPGRTKQSFKDSTDINKILAKAQLTGSLSHYEKHGAFYADFSEMPTDPFEARALLERGTAIFNEAPSEIRREFRNDPIAFFNFCNDPANSGRLRELLPAIAERGKYFPDVSPSTPPNALLGEKGPESIPSPPSGAPEAADAASDGAGDGS